ncbi:hypothetical protein BDF21DRAFT_395626 [Thamnidium elegans]|uniref:MHYT domain-containing protein n=1 Tax=Thamnidium elegans TaxID=101142 RepID=A0A8H7VU72_9FUNG|nr:hypothetical protein INT48_003677 [Thamnidium elegans]KAI8091933.1 hypothetical protein BDF21DRAFT_395626 [Thamnidium elegans]
MEYAAEVAQQNYDGGIIFVSYLISVIGAQTTLELLNRRTHITGLYNWFLLAAAAFVMGAVSIWSMHFIGNNSLTLTVRDSTYQLSYSAGYTFASLVVVIACMFLAFIFVGITEDAKITRIAPSGIFAGLGVVCMHYMGQFAIDYFVLVYLTPYIIGAAVIAMSAVTAALYIFFKLRERWMNVWYKRLGCAMLMALAVCGMHYTALVGTIFYRPNYSGTPPIPKLQTPALIGIISGIIVSACIGLLYISIKTGMRNLPLYTKNTNKRLILDAAIFDPLGRILVKIDGTLPMTEIAHNLELNETKREFCTSHPLFIRLFEASIAKASLRFKGDKRPSGISSTSSIEAYDAIERQFLNATHDLRDELHFDNFGDIGILSDIVVTTDTISKANMFIKSSQLFRNSTGNSAWSHNKRNNEHSLTNADTNSHQQQQSQSNQQQSDEDEESTYADKKKKSRIIKESKKKARKSKSSWSVKKSFADDEEITIESHGKRSSGGTTVVVNGLRSSSEETQREDSKSINDRLSVEDSDGEDKHIFMVKKLVDERDVSRLLSQGYRFAEPVFIAKTMATKLRIPTDWMRQHFIDMQQMSDSICALTQHDWLPSAVEPAPNPTEFKATTKGSVYMGAFVLIDETHELTNMQIVVDKTKRFTFPKEQLILDHQVESMVQLDKKETDFVSNLQGCSLFDFSCLSQTFTLEQTKSDIALPSFQFIVCLENAAKKLLDATSYSKALYQKSKLHTTVLELPPFALTTGPCQLIVFKSLVNTKGALTAVNHTFSEPMKCMPLKLYKCLSGFITDEAARIYQASLKTQLLPTYLAQQQMYRQQASTFDQKRLYSSSGEEDIPMGPLFTDTNSESFQSGASSPTNTIVADPFSLPPPPRAKRQRFKLAHTILGNSNSDHLTPLQDYQPKSSIKCLSSSPLTILATQDRYWWINTIVEETIHSSMD